MYIPAAPPHIQIPKAYIRINQTDLLAQFCQTRSHICGCGGLTHTNEGDILETENSMILLGNVYPGSTAYSAKNIIILGGLYGEACAGGFVAALEMKPEKIKIGDFKYRPRSKQFRWQGRIHLKVLHRMWRLQFSWMASTIRSSSVPDT